MYVLRTTASIVSYSIISLIDHRAVDSRFLRDRTPPTAATKQKCSHYTKKKSAAESYTMTMLCVWSLLSLEEANVNVKPVCLSGLHTGPTHILKIHTLSTVCKYVLYY